MNRERTLSLRNALFISLLFHLIVFFQGQFRRNKNVIVVNIPVDFIYLKQELMKKETPLPEKIKKLKTKPEVKKEKVSENKNSAVEKNTRLMLDKSFPFAYYLKILKNKISSGWRLDKKYPNLKIVVYFSIKKTGEISEIKIEETSGVPSFDNIAVMSVLSATPFPPLPEEYKEESLGMHIGFETRYIE